MGERHQQFLVFLALLHCLNRSLALLVLVQRESQLVHRLPEGGDLALEALLDLVQFLRAQLLDVHSLRHQLKIISPHTNNLSQNHFFASIIIFKCSPTFSSLSSSSPWQPTSTEYSPLSLPLSISCSLLYFSTSLSGAVPKTSPLNSRKYNQMRLRFSNLPPASGFTFLSLRRRSGTVAWDSW